MNKENNRSAAGLVTKTVHDDIEELEEIGEPRGEMGPSLYMASQTHKNKDVQPVYSSYLGLAIEPLPDGITLKSLFEVQTSA